MGADQKRPDPEVGHFLPAHFVDDLESFEAERPPQQFDEARPRPTPGGCPAEYGTSQSLLDSRLEDVRA